MNEATLTLALEKVLLDPRFPGALAALRRSMNVSVRDQGDAAADHVSAFLRGIGAAVDGDVGQRTFEDCPDWLRLGLLLAINSFFLGTADTCLHSPSPDRPGPVFAAACKPGVITCQFCVHLLKNPPGGAADMTCDACGHVCAGVEAGDGVFVGATQFGVLLFMYGTCRDCRPPASIRPTS
jgi:hypothetical protein